MGRTAVNVAGQALVPTIVAKREGILDQATYDAPRGRDAWREAEDSPGAGSRRCLTTARFPTACRDALSARGSSATGILTALSPRGAMDSATAF